MESIVWLAGKTAISSSKAPVKPNSIFVLRNNDIGDLLVITPLFEALRINFPESYIVAGVGQWNAETLKLNPYISEILMINAPWHNKFISPQNVWDAIKYIWFSRESRQLTKHRFDVGIDVLGSQWGSLLMIHARISYRLGVKGYAGGHLGVQQFVRYSEFEHVGRSALRFAELLGAKRLPPCRPQIFLSPDEREKGEQLWAVKRNEAYRLPKRIVIGLGGGFIEKCWPLEYYASLVSMLGALNNVEIVMVGGKQDYAGGEHIMMACRFVRNFAGQLTLRETFALVAAADMVICNASMLMHAAAAFFVSTVVLLGPIYSSAKQYESQWGYDEKCKIFGKESSRNKIYTPQEAFEAIKALLAV